MRTFVGIDLDDSWRDALSAACEAVREVESSWRDDRWVPADNLHLTLKFMGEIPGDMLPSLADQLTRACAAVTPFALPLDRAIMAVPRPQRATMLWTCFDDPDGRCAALASIVQDVSATYGVAPDTREFRPHVTLVRARRPRKLGPHSQEAGADAVVAALGRPWSLSVSAVTLFTSELTPTGAVYERIASADLLTR